MKTILGVSAFYHDSAAALVHEGEIAAAAQEERFTRKKHDDRFPINATEFCLRSAGISAKSVDYVAFYEKPLLKFDRILETYLEYAPRGFCSFCKAMPQWLKTKLHQPREIKKALGKELRAPLIFVEHHMSHAASAFYPSPFGDSAIVTLDGVGEWDTTSIAVGKGNQIEILKTIGFPHSIGLLYSAFTYFIGFKVNSGEYKLMGLAPYGTPRFEKRIWENLIDLKEDGSFALNMDYFTYPHGLAMTGERFEALFEIRRRLPEELIEQAHMDLAASIQSVTEKLILEIVRHARVETGLNRLCLAGGVALNCVANGKLAREKIFDEIWIQPAAGDAGGSLGAALFTHYQLLNNPRSPSAGDSMNGSCLGPAYSNEVIEKALKENQVSYERYSEEDLLLSKVATLIDEGQVVGWFQGRMEFGPRALGSRSILGDPRSADMQTRMNVKIKFRESFRPFAPCVLKEDCELYFEMSGESPYMLSVAPVAQSIRNTLTANDEQSMEDPDLFKRVRVVRSQLPAITHVDYSARIQTVDEARHGRMHRLLKTFKELTGCSVIVNTSFNVRGEPIVNTPMEALRCFLATDMDALVLEDCLLLKSNQPRDLLERYRGYAETFEKD